MRNGAARVVPAVAGAIVAGWLLRSHLPASLADGPALARGAVLAIASALAYVALLVALFVPEGLDMLALVGRRLRRNGR